MCSNKTLFTKSYGGRDWPTGCSLPILDLGYDAAAFSSFSLWDLIPNTNPKTENLSLDWKRGESMGLFSTDSSASFVVPDTQQMMDGWMAGVRGRSVDRLTHRCTNWWSVFKQKHYAHHYGSWHLLLSYHVPAAVLRALPVFLHWKTRLYNNLWGRCFHSPSGISSTGVILDVVGVQA